MYAQAITLAGAGPSSPTRPMAPSSSGEKLDCRSKVAAAHGLPVDKPRCPSRSTPAPPTGALRPAHEETPALLLAGVLGGVLGVDRVAIGDGFFELVGHCLLAARLIRPRRAGDGDTHPQDLRLASCGRARGVDGGTGRCASPGLCTMLVKE